MIQARLKLGQDAVPKEKPAAPTIAEYYKTFKRVYVDTGLRESTANNYANSFRLYILPKLAGLRIDETERQHVEELIADMTAKGLAKDTIRLAIGVLSVMFTHAKDNKLVHENPASRMGRYYRQANKVHEEIEPLTNEEVPVFLRAAMELCPQHFCLFLCAIHTGLRSGEIAGLHWGILTSKANSSSSGDLSARTAKSVQRRLIPSDGSMSQTICW